MSKLETLRASAASDPLPQRIRAAEELAQIVGRMAQDMANLTEETRQTMADGQQAAQVLADLANRLEGWRPPPAPPPIIHEAPIWPMLLAVVVMAATLGGSVYWAAESLILPRLAAAAQCQPNQDQPAATASPQTTEPKSKPGGGNTRR